MIPRSTVLEVHHVGRRLDQLVRSATCEHVDREVLAAHSAVLRSVVTDLPHPKIVRPTAHRHALLGVAAELRQAARGAACCLYRRPFLDLADRLADLHSRIDR